jgi:hypothetical protein
VVAELFQGARGFPLHGGLLGRASVGGLRRVGTGWGRCKNRGVGGRAELEGVKDAETLFGNPAPSIGHHSSPHRQKHVL